MIAIIALLAALLLPALRQARERSRQAACGSNLRQLGLAAHMYASDWGGKLPPYRDDLLASSYLRNSGGPSKGFLRLYAYVNSKAVFYCPNAPEGFQGILFSNGAISYNWLSGPNTPGNFLPPNVFYPAPVTEGDYQTTVLADKGAEIPLMADMVDITGFGPTCHLPPDNPQGGNVLHGDGHVVWKPVGRMTQKSIYAWW